MMEYIRNKYEFNYFLHATNLELLIKEETKMKTFNNLLVIISVFLFISCGSEVIRHKAGDIPKWWLNPPIDSLAIYGVGEGDAFSLSLARDAAEARARADIARQFESKVVQKISLSLKQVGRTGESQNTQVQSSAVQAATKRLLPNTIVVKREVVDEGEGYKAYVLVKLSLVTMIDTAKNIIRDGDFQRQINVDAELQAELDKEMDDLDTIRQ